jgi:hypothetical protein
MRTLVTRMARWGLSANENACALISMMARSKSSNQRPDTLMQNRNRQLDENLLQRAAGPYIRVKMRNTPCEQMFSAPSKLRHLFNAAGTSHLCQEAICRARSDMKEVAHWGGPNSVTMIETKIETEAGIMAGHPIWIWTRFLIALLRKIPDTEKGWPASQRMRWFRTFAMNVSQIYDGDAEPVEMKIELESDPMYRVSKGWKRPPQLAALLAFFWSALLGSWKPHTGFSFVVDARKYEQRSYRSQNQSIKARRKSDKNRRDGDHTPYGLQPYRKLIFRLCHEQPLDSGHPTLSRCGQYPISN